MSTPFYSKLDKSAADLLEGDDFDLQKELSIATKGPAGSNFTWSVTSKDVKKDSNFPDETDRVDTNAKLKAEFKTKVAGEFTGEVDALQLLSLTWKSPAFSFLPQGVKFEVKAKHDRSWDKVKDAHGQWTKVSKLDCFVSDQVNYIQDNLAVTAMYKATNTKEKDKFADHNIGASGVLRFNNIVFGAEFENNFVKTKKQDFAVGFLGTDFSVVAKTAKVVKEASLSYHHAVLPNVSVAGKAGYVFATTERKFSFGLSHKIDDSSKVRGLVSVEGSSASVSVLYSALLNKYSKLSLSSVIDAKQLAGGDHKVGVKLEIGDL